MKRVWLVRDHLVLGEIGTSWRQSWGLSHNSRTGAWTLYDRRDARLNHEGYGEDRFRFGSSAELFEILANGDLEPSDLHALLMARPENPFRELVDWLQPCMDGAVDSRGGPIQGATTIQTQGPVHAR